MKHPTQLQRFESDRAFVSLIVHKREGIKPYYEVGTKKSGKWDIKTFYGPDALDNARSYFTEETIKHG